MNGNENQLMVNYVRFRNKNVCSDEQTVVCSDEQTVVCSDEQTVVCSDEQTVVCSDEQTVVCSDEQTEKIEVQNLIRIIKIERTDVKFGILLIISTP